MRIIGICRFSMLGRGDWKAYRGIAETEVEGIVRSTGAQLFAPARMEARLATFEHLTLASIEAQTDPDFLFVVLSSDAMPQVYRDRLTALCSRVPQVVLRFLPPIHAADAQAALLEEMGLDLGATLQFRLDDDDCVSQSYIGTLRAHAHMMRALPAFAISFPNVLLCTAGRAPVTLEWYRPFLGVGVALRHERSVFTFGHFALPERMVALTDPSLWSIVTHRGEGDNDTPTLTPGVQKRGMKRVRPEKVAQRRQQHFPFLTPAGARLCGWRD